ncbi:MAG: hypothetical protein NUW21_13875, partial [Elusimicrobia bacterium]|nr:hypothetical protein [Elusimicrobiota bacterium]
VRVISEERYDGQKQRFTNAFANALKEHEEIKCSHMRPWASSKSFRLGMLTNNCAERHMTHSIVVDMRIIE